MMDTVFWTGLLLGALIGFPISITANLWTDPVRELLHKRRRIRYSKKRSRELRRYFYVKALREGDPTAKILFDMESAQFTCLLMLAMFSVCFLVGCLLVIRLPEVSEYKLHLLVPGVVIGILGLLADALLAPLFFRQRQIQDRLRRFEEYEQTIHEKWGDAIQQHQPPPSATR